jgi:hypothetical protein
MLAAIVSGLRCVTKPHLVTQFTLLKRKQKGSKSECAANAKILCMHTQESAILSIREWFEMPLSLLGTLVVSVFPVLPSGIVLFGPRTKCIKRVDSDSDSFVGA